MLEVKECDRLGLMHDENTAHSKFGVRCSKFDIVPPLDQALNKIRIVFKIFFIAYLTS
jgi:hypothetical protein